MSIQKKAVTKFSNKPSSLRIQREDKFENVACAVGHLSIEDRTFHQVWSCAYCLAQYNPVCQEGSTLRRVYDEYLRRVEELIKRVRAGENWRQLSEKARTAVKMNEVLYSREFRIGDDELLVWLSKQGHSPKRAREIVNETHARRKHRPKDPKIWLESFSDYDLSQNGKNISQIAYLRYGRRCNRTEVEKIRQRVNQVKKLLNECGLTLRGAR